MEVLVSSMFPRAALVCREMSSITPLKVPCGIVALKANPLSPGSCRADRSSSSLPNMLQLVYDSSRLRLQSPLLTGSAKPFIKHPNSGFLHIFHVKFQNFFCFSFQHRMVRTK
ncbi:hypothetical protein CHARACLAT_033431 [Characodon lateralis]|uniref:Uncharacterized protein n=1 Tax=Characodon lateralis TaxID=208331 RepID=A0ABU7DET0_9TELE|nr:hypothetical protein [Characodon lateralis]